MQCRRADALLTGGDLILVSKRLALDMPREGLDASWRSERSNGCAPERIGDFDLRSRCSIPVCPKQAGLPRLELIQPRVAVGVCV